MSVSVSIIIPTYNREDYVCEAVDSVLAQNGVDFEIIVVDDGSSDGTWGLLKNRYGSNSCVKLIRQENKGVSAARNRGIKEATGELIAFLDSDDLMLPDSLSIRCKSLLSLPKSVGLIFGDFFREFEAGVRDGETFFSKFGFLDELCQANFIEDKVENNVWILNAGFLNYLAVHYSINTQTVVIRKRLLDKVGLFDETLDRCEDWDLYIRLAMVSKTACLVNATVVSRMWIAGLTSDTIRTDYCIIELMNRNMKRVSERESMKAIGQRRKEAHFRLAYWLSQKGGSRLESLRHAIAAAIPPGHVSRSFRLVARILLPKRGRKGGEV